MSICLPSRPRSAATAGPSSHRRRASPLRRPSRSSFHRHFYLSRLGRVLRGMLLSCAVVLKRGARRSGGASSGFCPLAGVPPSAAVPQRSRDPQSSARGERETRFRRLAQRWCLSRAALGPRLQLSASQLQALQPDQSCLALRRQPLREWATPSAREEGQQRWRPTSRRPPPLRRARRRPLCVP